MRFNKKFLKVLMGMNKWMLKIRWWGASLHQTFAVAFQVFGLLIVVGALLQLNGFLVMNEGLELNNLHPGFISIDTAAVLMYFLGCVIKLLVGAVLTLIGAYIERLN